MKDHSIPIASEVMLAHRASKGKFNRPLDEYTQLKQLVKQKGLLERQPAYYTYKILSSLTLLVASIAFLFLVNNFWLQLLDAAFLAFVWVQNAFVAHDAGHREVFRTTWRNDLLMLVQADLLVGISSAWWLDSHNAHHSHPNQLEMDPNVSIAAICYTEEEALSRRGILRFLVKYQAFLFFPLTTLVAIDFQRISILSQLKQPSRYRWIELVLLALHHILYFGLIFYRLNLWHGILFILVHQALFGLYLGSTFAPNHKGMPILEQESKLDFLHRQVLTARNISSHPFIDFCFGGLNYQIEHHLFPSMPRNNLVHAQPIIKAFCREHSIDYYETTALQSYWEILASLHQTSAPLRRTSQRCQL